ncbi:MAG: phospholipase D family protein [Xanthomonadales bacterium]|jgi:putative cardiolipin synthase|nr:phospholipase D family protein [Xanthomonadales bacterium]
MGDWPTGLRTAVLLCVVVLLTACAGPALKENRQPPPPGHALPPATEGVLADMAQRITATHGEDRSGFYLLDGSYDGLAWRLALIDSAVSSVDIQTYLWYPDNAGRLMLDRAIRAADRGVRVRLIVDDLLTIGLDQVLVELQRHPNIDFRVFNPWEKRGVVQRAGEMAMQLERLNIRMHDKLMVVDGHATIVGGRNLGDHYFGLSEDYNFHDLDVLGLGPVAAQAHEFFDHFWNSDWVVSAEDFDLEADDEFARDTLRNLRRKIAEAPELEAFPRLPADWTGRLEELYPRLRPGRSLLVYDQVNGDSIEQEVAKSLFPAMERADEELLITNAYIIPDQPSIDFTRELTERGVRVRILTNSLESHDVPAVNSHYRDWRDDFVQAGAELYELRADAAISSLVDVPPVQGEFVGLHTKAFVIDREIVFVGSMNFDPRSIAINTEGGVYIESAGLAEDLARIMERDMTPSNAWEVRLDDQGQLTWTHDTVTVDRQPARGFWQRFMDVVFKMFPKELY